MKKNKPTENPYVRLRNRAFSATPEQLGLSLKGGKTAVYGVVMDWDVGGGIATLVAFQTGDASMYFSGGGGLIGGGQHASVNKAAKIFVKKAQEYFEKTSKAEATPLPEKNCITFYLLTNKGKFAAQELLKNFDNSTSPWLELFEEGNNLINELRTTSEGK